MSHYYCYCFSQQNDLIFFVIRDNVLAQKIPKCAPRHLGALILVRNGDASVLVVTCDIKEMFSSKNSGYFYVFILTLTLEGTRIGVEDFERTVGCLFLSLLRFPAFDWFQALPRAKKIT